MDDFRARSHSARGQIDKIGVNALFISDLHVGAPESRLLDAIEFLQAFQPRRIYLVGDIIDVRAVKHKAQISARDLGLLFEALNLIGDVPLTYLAGNHDPEVLLACNFLPRGMEVRLEAEHVTEKGEKILVFHGHQVDTHVGTDSELLLDIVCFAYSALLRSQLRLWRFFHLLFGISEWNFVGSLRYRSHSWVQHVSTFEKRISDYARQRGYDAAICGHIHVPRVRRTRQFSYYNTGDWVEDRTALVETLDGKIVLLGFDKAQRKTFTISDDEAGGSLPDLLTNASSPGTREV